MHDPIEVNALALIYTPTIGRPRFSADQLTSIPQTQGARQKRISALLKLGKKPDEIVEALSCTFSEVHEVYEWLRTELGSVTPIADKVRDKQREQTEREEKRAVKLAEITAASLGAKRSG